MERGTHSDCERRQVLDLPLILKSNRRVKTGAEFRVWNRADGRRGQQALWLRSSQENLAEQWDRLEKGCAGFPETCVCQEKSGFPWFENNDVTENEKEVVIFLALFCCCCTSLSPPEPGQDRQTTSWAQRPPVDLQ